MKGVHQMENIDLYTFEEARAILKTSKKNMRELLNTSKIKGFRVGKYNWRIPKTALADYIETQMQTVSLNGNDSKKQKDPKQMLSLPN